MYARQSVQSISENLHLPTLLDPYLLKAARQIYRGYQQVNPEHLQRPLGVAINRLSYRGQVIFVRKPVLLPDECFIPFEAMEAELH